MFETYNIHFQECYLPNADHERRVNVEFLRRKPDIHCDIYLVVRGDLAYDQVC